MKRVVGRCLLLAILLIAAASASSPAYAQEAAISGTVTDQTGAVLPGVTISATHEASGAAVVAATDERGGFRVPIRVGVNSVTAQLDGFTTVTQTGIQVLAGQQITIKVEMRPAALQESITVTGEAPLINITQSELSSNIDPRQLSNLPVNGRNWMDLTMLAPGSRLNTVGEMPAAVVGNFQLNVDGQQVTQNDAAAFGQPRYSEDAIAEFEFVANRFDASQGRSGGVQVNAITKSGTNTFAGTMSGFFRDDKFNAADFIARRVLPYSNQQVSTTFGGPIRRDKLHFFANYEYERQPLTFTYNSPYPRFNIDQAAPGVQNKSGMRVDFQVSPRSRLAVRATHYHNDIPYDPRFTGGATRGPASAIETNRYSSDANVTLTQVLNSQTTNEVKSGWAAFYWTQESIVSWPNHPNAYQGITHGAPLINLQGYAIGQTHAFTPQNIGQDLYSLRDDLTFSLNRGGRQTLKVGGEFLYHNTWNFAAANAQGIYDATGGAVPANIQDLFPVWNDVSTWNLNALNPIMRSYRLGIGNFRTYVKRNSYAGWVQDDWNIVPRVTLNLGLRYDYANNLFAQDVALPPFLAAERNSEKLDFSPRLGLTYSLTDKTVLRGGFGKYYADVSGTANLFTKSWTQQTTIQVQNDGRADFATNPFRGPVPTFDQVISSGARRTFTSAIASPLAKLPFSYQSSIGVQRQLSTVLAVQADFVYNASRNVLVSRNINLSFNPATGANYAFTDIAHLPYAAWDQVLMNVTDGKTNYKALQMALTRRFANRWQASATYTLGRERNLQPAPVNPGCAYPMTFNAANVRVCDVPISLAPDLAEQWYRTGEQTHRAVFNGIWEVGYGFQVSGLYFFADNGRDQAVSGVDSRNVGVTTGRLRANGTLIPWFALDRANLHRVDVRLQRKFQFSRRFAFDGIIDVFNAFNHENFGTYVTNERNAAFGQPTNDTGTSYQPRTMQLGLRATF